MIARAGRAALAGALATVLAAAVQAAIPEDPRGVLDRYLEATGGRAAALAERSVHVKGTLAAFGLQGSFESWSQRPDRNASVTVIGPFTLREGYDGRVAWRVDQNGKFSRLDGKDLDDARASAWFENGAWLAPDQGGGAIVRLPDESDSSRRYAVLEVTPPQGRSRRLWFSLDSGVLARSVGRQDQHTVTQRFSDFRTTAGRLRPHVITISSASMPGNDVRLTVDSVWIDAGFDPAVFEPRDLATRDVRFLAAPPARLPFDYSARHVWLRASVNGRPEENFLLDTGASVTVIDSAYAARVGLRTEGAIQVSGAGAAGGASLSRVDSLRLGGPGGGVVLLGQKVAVMALDRWLEPFFWRSTAGVLGYDFVSRFVTEVGYDGRTIVLHEPGTFRYRGKGAAIPLTMAGNIPVVKARLDDRYEGEFRLDVGSGSTVDLHAPFVERHRLRERAGKTLEVTGGGFGGTFTTSLTRMAKFQIGPHAWERPLVSLSRATTGGLSSQDYAGNIGNQILERFTCTFDYERRVVYLEPGQRFAEPDRFSLAGVQLARFGEVVRAMQVLPGSPAEQAGVHADDQVVRLDGRAISSYTLDQVNEVLERGQPGAKHVIEVLRDGKRRKLTIRLREML
jgi:aspartyl protease/PDZ domain-containing protein